MHTRSLEHFRISRTLLVFLLSLLLVSAKDANQKYDSKSQRSQPEFLQNSNHSRFLQETPTSNEILGIQEPPLFFLSSHVQSEADIGDNQIHYYKAIVSPRDIQLTLTLSGTGSTDLFLSLDPENRYPNEENCTISTIMTQTSDIELYEDDLNLLCSRQFSSLCYLYVSVAQKSSSTGTYSLQLERTQQVALRKKPSISLKDSQKLHFPVPITNDSPEIFYFSTVPYEPSFVTVSCPGRKISIYAQILSNDKSPRSSVQEPSNTNYNYSSQFDQDAQVGLVQLAISALKDEASIAVTVYFENIDANSESLEMYSILLTSQIKPIIADKQYHETLPTNFDGLYQYYALGVHNGTSSFTVSLKGSDTQDLSIAIAAPNQKLPINSNSQYEVKNQSNAKIVEVTNSSSIVMAGTWIIRVNGPTSKNFTLTVRENKDTATENESGLMLLENGITYTQHLTPVGLNTYLFYVNKLDDYILTIKSTGPKLKLYLSDNPTDDPNNDLWTFEIASPGKIQILNLPGYDFYNNSLSSEYTTRWNGKENIKFKQKPAYLLVENSVSSDAYFDILFVSNERLWNRDFVYSFSLQPQSSFPIIMYTSDGFRKDYLVIEFQVSVDQYPKDQVLDITGYFWQEDSQSVPTRTVQSDQSSIRQVYSLNNTYLIRQEFDVTYNKGKFIVLVRNPLLALVDPLRVMMSKSESYPTYYDSHVYYAPFPPYLVPGVWSFWLFSCKEPFSETSITSLSDPFWPGIKSPNLEMEHLYQMPTNTSGMYQISVRTNDNEIKLQGAFFPMQIDTYRYTLKSQSLKFEAYVLAGTNNTKNISIKIEPIQIEDYDASADSVVYKIRISSDNITLCSYDKCYLNGNRQETCNSLVPQNKTRLSDRDEIRMSFELPRAKRYDSDRMQYVDVDRLYYTVNADIMHYDQVIRSVLYQPEMIEFPDGSSEPTNEAKLKNILIIIGLILAVLVVVGFIFYRQRLWEKDMRHHRIRPRANDNQELCKARDAEDNIEVNR